jgi:hypothetical protein
VTAVPATSVTVEVTVVLTGLLTLRPEAGVGDHWDEWAADVARWRDLDSDERDDLIAAQVHHELTDLDTGGGFGVWPTGSHQVTEWTECQVLPRLGWDGRPLVEPLPGQEGLPL